MSENCTEISENITKLSFPGDNLGFTTEIDGREHKEDFLNFPFDHMYACNSDNSDLNSDRQAGDSEVRQLKDLLLLHLDLIQQQSDEIVNKDKFIVQLRQENEMLKQRLDRMEHRTDTLPPRHTSNNSVIHNSNNSFALDSFPDNMTHDTGFCADNEDPKDNLKVMGLCNEDSDYKPLVVSADRRSVDRDSGGDSMGPSDRCYAPSRRTKSSSSTIAKDALDPLNASNTADLHKIPDNYPDSTTIGVRSTLLLDDDDDDDDDDHRLHSHHHNNHHHHDHLHHNHHHHHHHHHHHAHPRQDGRQFTLRPNSRRKRLCSSSSQLSNNESLASAPDEQRERRKSATHHKRRKGALKRVSILTTDSPYITQAANINATLSDEQFESLDVSTATTLEVPRWRVKVYTSCYTMEGTENLDDDVYNRRHMRLENDERRRKRWDVQRIREQRHVERLKQRQERQGLKSDEQQTEPPASFWPALEDVRFIEVTDELPVSAFGTPIPKLNPSEFRLPWLNGTMPAKKPQTRKSTARRKSSKR